MTNQNKQIKQLCSKYADIIGNDLVIIQNDYEEGNYKPSKQSKILNDISNYNHILSLFDNIYSNECKIRKGYDYITFGDYNNELTLTLIKYDNSQYISIASYKYVINIEVNKTEAKSFLNQIAKIA